MAAPDSSHTDICAFRILQQGFFPQSLTSELHRVSKNTEIGERTYNVLTTVGASTLSLKANIATSYRACL